MRDSISPTFLRQHLIPGKSNPSEFHQLHSAKINLETNRGRWTRYLSDAASNKVQHYDVISSNKAGQKIFEYFQFIVGHILDFISCERESPKQKWVWQAVRTFGLDAPESLNSTQQFLKSVNFHFWRPKINAGNRSHNSRFFSVCAKIYIYVAVLNWRDT